MPHFCRTSIQAAQVPHATAPLLLKRSLLDEAAVELLKLRGGGRRLVRGSKPVDMMVEIVFLQG